MSKSRGYSIDFTVSSDGNMRDTFKAMKHSQLEQEFCENNCVRLDKNSSLIYNEVRLPAFYYREEDFDSLERLYMCIAYGDKSMKQENICNVIPNDYSLEDKLNILTLSKNEAKRIGNKNFPKDLFSKEIFRDKGFQKTL